MWLQNAAAKFEGYSTTPHLTTPSPFLSMHQANWAAEAAVLCFPGFIRHGVSVLSTFEGWGKGPDASLAQVGGWTMMVPECGDRWANGGPFFSYWLTSLSHQRIIIKKKLSLPKRRNLKILGRTASIYHPLFIYSKRRLGIEVHKISWVLEETGIKEVEVLWWISQAHACSLRLAIAAGENSRNGTLTSTDVKENSHWTFT